MELSPIDSPRYGSVSTLIFFVAIDVARRRDSVRRRPNAPRLQQEKVIKMRFDHLQCG